MSLFTSATHGKQSGSWNSCIMYQKANVIVCQTVMQLFMNRFIMDSFGQRNYNPFDKDIALLEVFFKKPTIIQISRQARMSWIDYLSTVGGLLGLVLGMGIVSFIELLWLCLRIAALKMNFQNLVP